MRLIQCAGNQYAKVNSVCRYPIVNHPVVNHVIKHRPKPTHYRGWTSDIAIICAALICVVTIFSLPAAAGEVVVTRSSEAYDAFAVRDQVAKDFEWQESLRQQQQIQILQALPLGCVPAMKPFRYFTCGGQYYRPYQYQQQEWYVGIDAPEQ